MANEKTQVEIDAAVDAAIKANGNREITPPLHNAIEKMLSNSNLNKKDGGILQALAFYNSAFSLTNPLTLVYKSYVDDLITALNAITQGTNTLTEHLFLDGGGLYDLALIDANLDLNGGWIVDPTLVRYAGNTAVDFTLMQFRKTAGGTDIGIDVNNSRLSFDGSVKFQWDTGIFYNASAQAVSDFDNQALKNYNGSSNVDVIDWMIGLANDFSGDPSYNWFDREFYGDWSTDGDFSLTDGKFTYYKGNESTDGSIRIGMVGTELVAQRRVAGAWTTENTIIS